MITWGLVGNSHDASLAVWVDDSHYGDNGLRYAALTGAADHSAEFFNSAKRRYGDPDKIVWYERPRLKTLRQWRAGQGWLWKENNIRQYLLDRGVGYTKITNKKVPIHYVQHHLSHAAYAYYTQPHDDCAVICLDSIGEFETLTIWHGHNNKLKKIHSQKYPHSLGLYYSAMTQRLGLVPQRDEYLVSQWAAKGDPHKYAQLIFDEIVETIGMGYKPYIRMRENMHRGIRWWRPEIASEQELYDLAAAVQWVFEYCVCNLSEWTRKTTGSKNLALAGGGALNRDAVNRIRRNWDTVWVPPNPGDPGSCIGAILADKKQRIDNIDKIWNR